MQGRRAHLYRAVICAVTISIHSTNAQDRFLRRAPSYLVVIALLLITAHRLPAPISEESTPTPPPEQSAKQKRKPLSKPKPKPEASESATNPAKQQRTSKQSRFAGVWVGTMPTFPMGPAAVVLTVDSTETTMAMNWRGSTVTVKAQRNGDTLQATSPEGIYTNTWSLTPQPDGTTARVRMQAFMNDFNAVFHRTAESSAAKIAR